MKAICLGLGLSVAVGLCSPGLLWAAPPNDDFAAATIVAGFPATATGSNVDATMEAGEPVLGEWFDYSVWYRWTAPTSGAVRIDTLEGGRDTILAVWTNAALTNLALVAQNDGYDQTEASAAFFDAVSGTTYQIAVYGYDYDLGEIALRITNDALPRISGTVTGPGGAPALAGIEVQVRRWSEVDEWWYRVNEATSDGAGNYEVRGIPAGTYRVGFHDEAGDYLTEAFDDAADVESGTDVVVGAADVTGVDAELGVASKISGTVTGPGGETPLEGIEVSVRGWNESWGSWSWVGDDLSDAAGAYSVGGLTAGTYRVEFSDWRNGTYLTEFYSNAADVDSGADVIVGATTNVTGIDASLVAASKISGTVTGPGGEPPLEDIQATAYGWNESWEGWESVRGGWTDASGNYVIGGLTAGTYRVEFRDDQNGDYLAEFYADAADVESGTDVPVHEGEAAEGIDASLGVAGKISGTVTGTDGETPLAGILARAYRWNEEWEYWESVSGSYTDEAGIYTLGGLVAGTYRVGFWDTHDTYASEAYSNAVVVEWGMDIVVVAGETAAGIDAELAEAAQISGTVTGPDGETPLPDIWVTAWIQSGNGWSVQTDAEGAYLIGGLVAGQYRVQFQDESSGYLSEYFSNAVNRVSGTVVEVGAGETATGIDASLTLASKISGTVTGSDGVTPLAGIYVDLYHWDGVGWQWLSWDETEPDGRYGFEGLRADSYRIRFGDPAYLYHSQVYANAVDLESGQDVVVGEAEDKEGVDVRLVHVNSAGLEGIRLLGGGAVEVLFTGTEEMNYVLQEATSLMGEWTDVGSAVVAGAGTNALPRAAGATQQYWRVRLVP